MEENPELDPEKLRAALDKEGAKSEKSDDRKRSYHSLGASNVGVTPEEMEAYRIKKARRDDPLMAIEKGKAKAKGTDGYDLV